MIVMDKVIHRVLQRNSLLCPKCHGFLSLDEHHGVEVNFCFQCAGTWVDVSKEREILMIPSKAFTVDELKRLRRSYQPFGNIKSSGYPPCPVCQQLMHRKNWGSYSGVIVDFCHDHGTWYEAAELKKVREYVALGGVEYEKWQRVEQRLNAVDRKLHFLA